MGQPILYETSAFDAKFDWVLSFTYSGNQAIKNRLVIKENDTNTTAYDQTVETFQLRHTIPANTLTNGKCYNAQVQVIDAENKASPFSKTIIFWCFTNPSFGFSNLVENQIIKNSSYTLSLSYFQPEGEPLQSYHINLYDYQQQLLYSGSTKYGTQDMNVTIFDLDDNSLYYVQAIGQTLNKMKVDTGLIPFSVEYILPSLFAIVNLENLEDEYSVKIESNIISILGRSNPDPPKYIDDKMVDLTEEGSWVKFDKAFSIDKNFTLFIRAKSLKEHAPFLILENKNGYSIELKYNSAQYDGQDSEKAFVELYAFNKVTSYFQMSNYIEIPDKDSLIDIYVRRINNLYEVYVENTGGEPS